MTSQGPSSLVEQSSNYSKVKYWDDIEEMPAWNWLQFIEKGMVKWLAIEGEAYTENEAMEAWHKLEDQYLERFGHGEEYKKILEMKYDIYMMYAEYLEFHDQDLEMEADMLLAEYRELTKDTVKFDFYKQKAEIERALGGTRMNLKEMSVVEYMTNRELARDVR